MTQEFNERLKRELAAYCRLVTRGVLERLLDAHRRKTVDLRELYWPRDATRDSRRLTAADPLFRATVGGLGLTGVILAVGFRMIAKDLSRRLIDIFLLDESGRRPVWGGAEKFQTDPRWRDELLFYEYFHGDNGAGIGASHQTGWSSLVANLIDEFPKSKK